jgi:fibronectin-binding autotransporter adhesin
MHNHKTKHKLMAMMLSVIMGVSLMPAFASAKASTLPVDTRGEIIAFEPLEDNIVVQNVPLGTSEASLDLPDTLTVTVQLEEPQLDSDMAGTSSTDITETDPMEQEELTSVNDTEETTSGEDEKESLSFNDEEKSSNSAEKITVCLPVTWYATPKYNSESSGTYVFTPNFSEGITIAKGIEMPTISVTVGTATILAFDTLPDEIRWQNTTSPIFPQTLGGITEDEDVQIPVTWEADHDYDADYPVRGLYVLTAVLEEGYIVANGIELPRITIYVPQTVSKRMALMARMSGGGTTDSPLEITTPAQLAEIAQLVNAGRLEAFLFNNSNDTTYLELKNDLNLSDYGASFHHGKGWTPIGTQANPFKGHFDGNGNKIQGLYIDDTSLSIAGLFGSVKGGTVQNLILTDASVRGFKEIGGIAGRIENATIKNCGITGSVRGNENIGGIVGSIFENGTVEHCYSAGSVISINNNAGGIAGSLNTATSMVQNCYSTSLLEGKQYIGGIAGSITTGTDIILNCAALNPSIHAQGNMGRVAGQNALASFSNNVAYSGMEGGTFLSDASDKDGEDITVTQIKADGTIGNRFTTSDGWSVADGSLPDFGTATDMPPYMVESSDSFFPGEGTSEDPFQISTAAQLAKLSELVRSYEADIYDAYSGKHYKLTADIDLSVYNADNTSFNNGKGWIPIGGYFAPKYEIRSFSGVFDCDGHIIKGLYINSPSSNDCGLFGHVNYGTVINLGIVDAYINGGYNVGGISGGMIGTVENCFISGKINGASSVGGMIGD